MPSPYQVDFDEPPGPPRVDWGLWLSRLRGWDTVLPLLIALVAGGIAWIFGPRPGIDALVLVPLPVAAFLFRLAVGLRQIGTNACGRVVRWLQGIVLVVGLVSVMIVDFFTALIAFNPQHGIDPSEIAATITIGTLVYLASTTFATYPGRRRGVVVG